MQQLDAPRSFWMMIPAGRSPRTRSRSSLRSPTQGDTIVDGGNSNFRDSQRALRSEAQAKGIHFVDAGVSRRRLGSRGRLLPDGRRRRRGGRRLVPCSRRWRRASAAARTPAGRATRARRAGWLHFGPSGAGHFVKMVHNGIEYGLMQAYAEGFEILKHANIGLHAQETDAETTPLRDPDRYKFELDLAAIAGSGATAPSSRRGCSTSPRRRSSSTAPNLDEYRGPRRGLRRGPLDGHAAIEEDVPAPGDRRRRSSPASPRAARPTARQASTPRCATPFGGHAGEEPGAMSETARQQAEPARGGPLAPADAGPVRARHLRRLRRPDAQEAHAGAVRARVPAAAAAALRDRRRRAHRGHRRQIPRAT